MTSWVYIFSRFTPEALLFESLGIFALAAGYAGYWVLRKRKTGPVEHDVPANVVRGYLNELIVDAEQLRAQLFGLLASAGVSVHDAARFMAPAPQMPAPAAAASPQVAQVAAADPELARKLASLEGKMAEQNRSAEMLLAEKSRLERELTEAKLAGQAVSGGAGDSVELSKLREKVQILESKLAEYSVIEDDLANLKRLQQENAQLKAALAGKGGSVEAVVSAPAAPAPAPVEASAPEPAAMPEAPAGDAGFEGLVDQVEQSLQPEAPAAEPAVAPEPVVAAAPPAPAPAAPMESGDPEKSDADLVAEFEKMLHG